MTFQAMAAATASGDPDETNQASGKAVTPTNTSRPPAQAANHPRLKRASPRPYRRRWHSALVATERYPASSGTKETVSQMPPRMDYMEYDPAYPHVFAHLTQTIHSVLPGATIEHVGSTSVPGLGGRGTLDCVLLSEPRDHATLVPALKQVGFAEFPYGAAQPALTCRVLSDGRNYEVLLYLLPPSHEYVRGWLAFRDFMRHHPEEIARYAAIKKAAIAEGKTQPWSYQQAKTPYLVELEQRIERESATAD